MANASFVDALSSLRRKAQLSGRPLSKQETAGAVAGYADTASERLYRGRSLELQKESDDRSYRLAKRAMDQDRRQMTATSVLGGAAVGYGIGSGAVGAAGAAGTGAALGAWGGPIGAVAGAGLGVIVSKCMIISACSDPHSYEMELSRIYRDTYMSRFELIGYYTIAPPIAALIHRNRNFKRVIKSQLVDHLVDYGEWIFGFKTRMKTPIRSWLITKGFMLLCRTVGKYQFYRKGVCYDGQ